MDDFDGGRPAVDRDQVHRFEHSERFRAQSRGECRASRALVHKTIWRDGHGEHVAQLSRGLEMPQVANVQQIEHAVAMDDLASRLPQGHERVNGFF